jgi:hypothetical protein
MRGYIFKSKMSRREGWAEMEEKFPRNQEAGNAGVE